MKKINVNEYSIWFYRPFESAYLCIKATCIEEAMENARLISEQRYRWLRFETDIPSEIRAINQIDVVHDASGETRRWLANHVRFRYVGEALVDAARNVLANWETGDLAAAIRQLSAAVETAEGGGK